MMADDRAYLVLASLWVDFVVFALSWFSWVALMGFVGGWVCVLRAVESTVTRTQ